MPSLRRSFSSPSVRSSPYPSSLSPGNPSTIRARASAPQPRRLSGSATVERRVLADIEWWRVYDGQCDLDLQDQVREDTRTPNGDVSLGGMVTLSVGGSIMEPTQMPLSLHSLLMDSMQSESFHPSTFNALSIAPSSPQGGRHGRDSSVESTPELSTAPLETVQLTLADPMSCPFGDHLLFLPSLTRAGGREIHPFFGLRSVSAPSFSLEPDFADMGGDTFSLDQNLFQ